MSQEKKRSPKKDRIGRNKPKFANNGLMNIKKKENKYGGQNAHGKHISEGWHTIVKDIDDVEKYIYDYHKEHKYDVVELMIGTDSLRKSVRKGVHEIRLMTVICLRRIGKGTHIIKRRESVVFERFVATGEKLNMEVNKTYEVAMWLHSLGLKFEVHMDLNPDENHESFDVYKNIQGWFEGLGFTVRYKKVAHAASFAADWAL